MKTIPTYKSKTNFECLNLSNLTTCCNQQLPPSSSLQLSNAMCEVQCECNEWVNESINTLLWYLWGIVKEKETPHVTFQKGCLSLHELKMPNYFALRIIMRSCQYNGSFKMVLMMMCYSFCCCMLHNKNSLLYMSTYIRQKQKQQLHYNNCWI